MRKVVLGVVAGVMLTIALIAVGLYYIYGKARRYRLKKKPRLSKSDKALLASNRQIAAYVYNDLRSGLSTYLAEGQSKDDLYSSLVTSLKKHAGYASGTEHGFA